MTREEAIEIIKYILEVAPQEPPTECDYIEEWLYENDKKREALDMAIEALSEPTKTEPTSEDVISREQAIRATYGFERYTGIDEAPYEYTENILRKLPTATPTRPEPKWISVDERLPENFQRVLVTIVNYNGNKVVRVAEYYGRQRIFQIKENNDQWEVGEKGLLAWRPLPEPYKAESEDKE